MKKKLLQTTTCFLFFLFFITHSFAQNKGEIKGIKITGIKGIKKSLATAIDYEKAHPLPENFKVKLRPELKGPTPKGQDPNAKRVSRLGTMIQNEILNIPLAATTQTVYSNFLAIWGSYENVSGRESPYTPPDNCGDVGTAQIVVTANSRMKVFNKPSVTGTASKTTLGSSTTTLSAVVNLSLNTLFSNPLLGINSVSDPHVRFDRLTKRWFIVAIDVNHNTNNYCCIAVSSGATITSSSSFNLFYFRVSATGGSSQDFFDFPTLGIDKNSINIGGNMFKLQNSFSGCSMWIINKADLIAGTLNITSFPYSITNTDMYTPQGVHNDSPKPTTGYFIGASQTFYSRLVIRRISYSSGSPVMSGDLNLSTSTTYSPQSVPTFSGIVIDGGDRRLFAAMIKKNKITSVANLWVAQGTLLNQDGIGGSDGDRNGVLWLEIGNLTTTPVIVQSATLYDGANPGPSAVNYTYPTIALSGQGHNVIGFTSTGFTKYTQAAVAGRYRTDVPGTFKAAKDFTTATSAYNASSDRWGDFTQTVVDPNDDMTMWTFSQYVPKSNSWGVRAAQLKAPKPAHPSLASTPNCGSSSITINGTSSNNSEFFDPGSDAGGPGFTRLKVSVKGPSTVTVSSVVFVSPTKITAAFTLPAGALAGTYKVFVTNPDGQKDSTTFTLASSCSSIATPVTDSRGLEVIKINTEQKNSLTPKVYPNPTESIVNLEMPSKNQQKINVEVFDLSGRRVINQSMMLNAGINLRQLSLSGLASGGYIIQFKNAQNVVIEKVKITKR